MIRVITTTPIAPIRNPRATLVPLGIFLSRLSAIQSSTFVLLEFILLRALCAPKWSFSYLDFSFFKDRSTDNRW